MALEWNIIFEPAKGGYNVIPATDVLRRTSEKSQTEEATPTSLMDSKTNTIDFGVCF